MFNNDKRETDKILSGNAKNTPNIKQNKKKKAEVSFEEHRRLRALQMRQAEHDKKVRKGLIHPNAPRPGTQPLPPKKPGQLLWYKWAIWFNSRLNRLFNVLKAWSSGTTKNKKLLLSHFMLKAKDWRKLRIVNPVSRAHAAPAAASMQKGLSLATAVVSVKERRKAQILRTRQEQHALKVKQGLIHDKAPKPGQVPQPRAKHKPLLF